MRRERILLALGLALAPTPSPAGKGSSGSGSPPLARPPATASRPAAKPVAGAPATWPTNAEVFATAKAGDWVAYTQSANQGGRSQSMALWQTYEGSEAGGPVVTLATAPSAGAPGAPPAPGPAGAQARRSVLKPGDPFQGNPTIPGATVVRDSTRSMPFTALRVGGDEYAGTRFLRDLALKLPNGTELTYGFELWLSPQVPTSGMVKYAVAVSPMAAVSTVEIVTSSRALAEAAAALAFETPEDVQRFGEAQAKLAWPADARDWDRQTELRLFAEARVRTLLGRGKAADAQAAYLALDPSSPGRYALCEELRRAAALRGDAAALGALGVPPAERAEAAVRYKAAALAERPGEAGMKELVAFVKSQADPRTRAAAFRAGMARAGRTEPEGAALLAALPSDAERLQGLLTDLPAVYQQDLDLPGLETLVRLWPPLAYAPRFLAVQAVGLARAGRAAEAKPLVERYLATLEGAGTPDPGHAYEAALVLEAVRDPRLATWRRRLATAHVEAYAKARAAAAKGAPPAYVDPELPRYLATLGELDQARALLEGGRGLDLSRVVEVAAALYGPGGKAAEAVAWREGLVADPAAKAAGGEFRYLGLQAEMDLGFARWERAAGTTAAYQARLASALTTALAANRALTGWNATQPDGKRLYWRLGAGRLHDDPYHYLVEFLVAQADAGHDAMLLEFLGKLQDEMPATGAVGDAWHDCALAAGKRAAPALLERLVAALPAGFDENSRTALLSEAIRPLAGRGDLAALDRLVAGQVEVDRKAELLRAAVIAMVDAGHGAEAAKPAADLKVLAGASAAHRTFGTVALGLGLARAGRLPEARAAFDDRTTDLREGLVHRRFNGREWPEVVYRLGLEVGMRLGGPIEAAAWCRDSKYRPETALLALGLAAGLASRP